MRLSHGSPALSATFDDPNLVSVGGLIPVVALAQSCRLGDLVAEKLTLKATGGGDQPEQAAAHVGGNAARAGPLHPVELLGHAGAERVFARIPGPAPVGPVLRRLT